MPWRGNNYPKRYRNITVTLPRQRGGGTRLDLGGVEASSWRGIWHQGGGGTSLDQPTGLRYPAGTRYQGGGIWYQGGASGIPAGSANAVEASSWRPGGAAPGWLVNRYCNVAGIFNQKNAVFLPELHQNCNPGLPQKRPQTKPKPKFLPRA